jgi:hypothetical protein
MALVVVVTATPARTVVAGRKLEDGVLGIIDFGFSTYGKLHE